MIVHVPMVSSSERRSDLVQRQGSPPFNEIRKAKSVGLDRPSAARRIRFAWEIAYRTNFPPISTAGRHFLSARTAGSNYGETDAAVPARPSAGPTAQAGPTFSSPEGRMYLIHIPADRAGIDHWLYF